MNDDSRYRTVYSTDGGSYCTKCQKPLKNCSCAAEARSRVQGDGNVRVRRETKGRGGKTVTTVSGLPLTAGELTALLSELKRFCGCGGSVKEGVLEIQGDHAEAIIQKLAAKGFKAKRAGG